jgi:hypothetical protein
LRPPRGGPCRVANVMTELPKIDWPKVTGRLIPWTDQRQKGDKATVAGMLRNS